MVILLLYIGEYQQPFSKRNYKGFDYQTYLKSKKIYGTVKVSKTEIQEVNRLNSILLLSNKISRNIQQKIKEILPADTEDLLIGILLRKYR